MVKDYGKICASSKSDKVFYGKNNTILWKDCPFVRPTPPIPPPALEWQLPLKIIIDQSWSIQHYEVPVDCLGFWTKSKGSTFDDPNNTNSGQVWTRHPTLYPHPDEIDNWPEPVKNVNGYKVWFCEYVETLDSPNGTIFRIDCEDRSNVDDTFELHFNWFYGDIFVPPSAEIQPIIRDYHLNYRSTDKFSPSVRKYSTYAIPEDKGFRMHFTKNGVLERVEMLS